MTGNDFTTSIAFEKDPITVFNALTQVSSWWTKDFEGSSLRLDDEFVICHPGQHYSKQRVSELVPGKKLAWLVTESEMGWLQKNKSEWTNTAMLFELSQKDGNTLLHFTHEGLTPEKECYERCCQGWSEVVLERLRKYVMEGIVI